MNSLDDEGLFNTSSINSIENVSDKPEPEKATEESELQDEELDDVSNQGTEQPRFKFDLEQLPNELTTEIKTHMQLFSNSGVDVLGLGRIEIQEDADFQDPAETEEDVGLDVSDIDLVEMFCEIEDIRFIYSFYPKREYNGLSTKYSILKELLLSSDVDALNSLNDQERISAVNSIEDILSPKDLGVILQYNRTTERSDLLSNLNVIRSHNSNVSQMIDRTQDGEIAGIRLERRVYVDAEKELPYQERDIFNSVQSMSNISRSYIGVLESAYIEKGANIPDSIAEKITHSITNKDWEEFDGNEEKENIRGFQ